MEANIPILEKTFASGIASNTIDMQGVLDLLRLYQFYPEKAQADTIAKALISATISPSKSDFNLAVCMVSEELVKN